MIDEAQLSDCVTLFSAFNVLYTDLLPQSILQFTAVFRVNCDCTLIYVNIKSTFALSEHMDQWKGSNSWSSFIVQMSAIVKNFVVP